MLVCLFNCCILCVNSTGFVQSSLIKCKQFGATVRPSQKDCTQAYCQNKAQTPKSKRRHRTNTSGNVIQNTNSLRESQQELIGATNQFRLAGIYHVFVRELKEAIRARRITGNWNAGNIVFVISFTLWLHNCFSKPLQASNTGSSTAAGYFPFPLADPFLYRRRLTFVTNAPERYS
jgi:hypothetical protein